MSQDAPAQSPDGGTALAPRPALLLPDPAWPRRGESTTASHWSSVGAEHGPPGRRMAAVSETASSCSSSSATMDAKGADAGGDYAMGGHSPATHSQAGAEFGGRDDGFGHGVSGACAAMHLQSVRCASVASGGLPDFNGMRHGWHPAWREGKTHSVFASHLHINMSGCCTRQHCFDVCLTTALAASHRRNQMPPGLRSCLCSGLLLPMSPAQPEWRSVVQGVCRPASLTCAYRREAARARVLRHVRGQHGPGSRVQPQRFAAGASHTDARTDLLMPAASVAAELVIMTSKHRRPVSMVQPS